MLQIPTTPSTDSSWTDDLPICNATGVGFSPNQLYRRDGYRSNEHELEDQSFHYRVSDNISLYGVFDGHNGAEAANFAVQRMPAEILLGQLSESSTEDEIQYVLHQAFLSVERVYFEQIIGQQLAERTALLSEIPEDQDLYQSLGYQSQSKLDSLNREVSSGTSAVVVLIFHGKLYVANVGDSRALLCRTDEDGVLRVGKLSVDHTIDNESELDRLSRLNVKCNRNSFGRPGNQQNTRCLGNYLVKGGYREIPVLQSAIREPIIPEPEIYPGIPLDSSCRFMILLSNGLYEALRESTNSDQVHVLLAQMIVEEFHNQRILTNVAQAVVDRISRMHHDFFMSSVSEGIPKVSKRDDMTLLVRNFNFPLNSAGGDGHRYSTGSLTPRNSEYLFHPGYSQQHAVFTGPDFSIKESENFTYGNDDDGITTETTSTTESSDLRTNSSQKLPLDENGHIAPYVNFDNYYAMVKANPDFEQQLML